MNSRLTFHDLAFELFREQGEIDFAELEPVDQRRLAAAYVRENAEFIVEDLFAELRPESVACHLATMIEHGGPDQAIAETDVFELAREIRRACWPNEALAVTCDAELAYQRRQFERYRAVLEAERRADAARHWDDLPALLKRQAG